MEINNFVAEKNRRNNLFLDYSPILKDSVEHDRTMEQRSTTFPRRT